jgi:hypothetical protein
LKYLSLSFPFIALWQVMAARGFWLWNIFLSPTHFLATFIDAYCPTVWTLASPTKLLKDMKNMDIQLHSDYPD